MADLATLQAWLAEAETAYHSLQIGKKTQELHHNGKRVIYTPAQQDELRAYIAELNSKIKVLKGQNGRKPIFLSPY
ncbi:phage tail protein [Methylovulum psychrotolerans]|uniref:gpW family protein n=1 Tax=Methylovulum psychrotolerans TaxID=1704499 RepID=UPI001BFF64CF|nr:gpW family protein [Methylovulum psychrotolerans]MBT9098408.1 phage tail protein [Methylovulum psychrotolerans]